MVAPLTLPKFFAAWLPALAIATAADPAPRLADAFLVRLGGIDVPLLTAVLGLLGVLMARPLAKRRETISLPLFVLVSAIMLIVVELWIVESRPGALFAFVIAIGLGFSGYSLIELVGTQIGDFVKGIVAIPTKRLGKDAADAASPDAESKDPQ